MDDRKVFKKILPLFITLFWLVMSGGLIYKEVILKDRFTTYQPFLTKNTLLTDEWMGVYFNDQPVGFLHTSIEPFMIKKGVSGYRIINRTLMNFLLFRKRNKVWFDAVAIVDEDYQLKSFSFELKSGAHNMKVEGEIQGGRSINLTIDSHGIITNKKIPLGQERGVIIANIISPFNSFAALKVGNRYNVKVFNPFSLELEPLKIIVSHKERMLYRDEETDVYVVKADYRGLEQIAYVNDSGEILKEMTGLGWVLLKEDVSAATRIYDSMEKSDVELAELVSVASNIPLQIRNITSLKIAISGIDKEFDLKNHRQTILGEDDNKTLIKIAKEEVDQEEALTLPIRQNQDFFKSDDLIQSEHKEIKNLARSIIAGQANSFVAATRINQWVYKNIRKTPVVSIPLAIDVLKTREGDCNEHSILFAALARSVGIPAKINVGLAYTNERFYYHAWCSVFIGKWVDMDPTFGQNIADVGHIKLIEGDLNKQLDIIKLLGKIKVEVIEEK